MSIEGNVLHPLRLLSYPRSAVSVGGYYRALGGAAFSYHHIFDSRKPGEEADFVAHANYFRGKPKIDRVTLRVIPDETVAVLALNRGEIGFMRILTPEAFKTVKQSPNLSYVATPATGILNVYLLAQGPLADVRVRQALAYAVNRDEYMNKLLGGLGAPPSWSVLPPAVPGHTENVAKYPYDVAKAASLRTSGERRGFGWKRWSRRWLYQGLGLYGDYEIQHLRAAPKVLPAR